MSRRSSFLLLPLCCVALSAHAQPPVPPGLEKAVASCQGPFDDYLSFLHANGGGADAEPYRFFQAMHDHPKPLSAEKRAELTESRRKGREELARNLRAREEMERIDPGSVLEGKFWIHEVTLALCAMDFALGDGFGSDAPPTPRAKPEIRVVKQFGTRCTSVEVTDVEPFNELDVVISIELKNNCDKPQLVEALVDFYLGPPERPIYFPAPGDRNSIMAPLMSWRSTLPKDLGFTPMFWDVNAAFAMRQNSSSTAQLRRPASDNSPVLVSLATCDLFHEDGTQQTAFKNTDSNFDIAEFACRPNHPPPPDPRWKPGA